ncbi:MAG TPA: hypothetical protein GXZ68_01965 [Firmicutes bacterium]|nr:hypothetical protein [Bacillota bacterium]
MTGYEESASQSGSDRTVINTIAVKSDDCSTTIKECPLTICSQMPTLPI